MIKRKIIEIDREKCDGCGICVNACHEGALQIVDGKAALVSDEYCDGLGDCLPACPMDAIKIIEREALPFNEELVKQRMQEKAEGKDVPCSCPGTMGKVIERPVEQEKKTAPSQEEREERPSELRQWPVQLTLINPQASYLKNADILIAADCTAYAYASFHEKFMKDRITIIGCPKLDDNEYYTEKIAQILKINNPNSITVIRMEVPCCSGIVRAVKEAMLNSGVIVPYKEVTINNQGIIVKE
jgi:NAD-dependent dihydropyrimidine dehydrogenase PreA subunit